MVVTFLGTGASQGVPTLACGCEVCCSTDPRDQRLRSSVHVAVNNLDIVIDAGPDFRSQMLRKKTPKLDALLLTHAHRDHTGGIDDVRGFNVAQKKDLPLYATHEVIEQIKNDYAYISSPSAHPGLPKFTICPVNPADPFSVDSLCITPIAVLHYELPIIGFRIQDFTYITDAKTIKPQEIAKIKGSRVLVLNALQQTSHIAHLSLSDAIALAQEIGAQETYLTHIGHHMGLYKNVTPTLPPNIKLAYDTLQVAIL